jgi:PAS domain S-box-containing protein
MSAVSIEFESAPEPRPVPRLRLAAASAVDDAAEFFDLAPDPLFVATLSGVYQRVNRRFERLVGCSEDEIVSRSFTDLVHPDDVSHARETLAALGCGEDVTGFESRLVRADGTTLGIEWDIRTVPEQNMMYGIGRDVTERRMLAEERIVAAADEERRRVLRDLHDGAQQRLVCATLMLALAQEALADGGDADSLMSSALENMQETTRELRDLAHGIAPSALREGGLTKAVEELALRTPVPLDLEVSPDRVPATVEVTAYFVIAEALTNIVKHAQAQSAAVSVRVAGDALLVEVRDDGVGGACAGGHGLRGLADRVARLEGRLTLAPNSGGGTVLAATIPLRGAEPMTPRPSGCSSLAPATPA